MLANVSFIPFFPWAAPVFDYILHTSRGCHSRGHNLDEPLWIVVALQNKFLPNVGSPCWLWGTYEWLLRVNHLHCKWSSMQTRSRNYEQENWPWFGKIDHPTELLQVFLCLHYLLNNFVSIVTKWKWFPMLVHQLLADNWGEVLYNDKDVRCILIPFFGPNTTSFELGSGQ